MRPIVISLCDLTGNMVAPWVFNGYDALLVDPQHGTTRTTTYPYGATVTRFAGTIEDAADLINEILATREVAFVFGFPPCTDLAVSGARWFERKQFDPTFSEYRGPNMFRDAMEVVYQCEDVGRRSGAPWMIENPKSRIATLWRPKDYEFNPWEYTAYCPEDNYKKTTWLWAGGGFRMPDIATVPGQDEPDNRIHFASPGPDRANERSKTPMGFAWAMYYENAKTYDFEYMKTVDKELAAIA